MRNYLLSALILMFSIGYGQGYVPVTDNLGWCLEQYFGLGSVQVDYVNKGDSTINNLSYHEFNRFNSNKYWIREDTLLRKVWVLDTANFQESLLYDFSLNLFDSVLLKFENLGNIVYQVDSIGLVSTPFGGRKAMILVTSDTNVANIMTWIEGIGSTFGPIYTHDITFASNAGYCLSCAYSEVGVKSYSGSCMIPCIGEPHQPCYSFIVGQEEFQTFKNPINFNIHKDEIIISTKSSLVNDVIIYTYDGRLKYHFSPRTQIANIDMTNWDSGVFIIHVELENGLRKSEKIIR